MRVTMRRSRAAPRPLVPLVVLAGLAAPRLSGALDAQLELFSSATYPEARCLDGTQAGIYWRQGAGDGSKNVLIFFQGGAWCTELDDPAAGWFSCAQRATTELGSSAQWPPTAAGEHDQNNFCCSAGGILSDDAALNPHMANWSVAFVGYCDGSSFSSYLKDPVTLPSGQQLYFRGRSILEAVLDSVLHGAHGAASWAESVVVSGCSAGGATVLFHLDTIRAAVPAAIPVYGLPDAGYINDMVGEQGGNHSRQIYSQATAIWGVYTTVPACQALHTGADAWRCLTTQYTEPFLTTPHFVVAAQYDAVLGGADAEIACEPVFNPQCSANDRQWQDRYRNTTIAHLAAVISPQSQHGIFLSACAPHCQTVFNGHENTWTQVTIGGVSPSDAFEAWRTSGPTAPGAKSVDVGLYGSNPTCVGV